MTAAAKNIHNLPGNGRAPFRPEPVVDLKADVEAARAAPAIAVEAALETARAELDATATGPDHNKTIIRRVRGWAQKQLTGLRVAEEALQVRIAAAKTARDNTLSEAARVFDEAVALATADRDAAIAKANADHEAIHKDVEADLYQITEGRKGIELLHGHMMKSELQ